MDKFNFDKIIKRWETEKSQLPTKLGAQAVNHFVKSFTIGGLDNKPWKEVQRRIPGTKAYLYPKNKGLSRRTNPILVNTGALRRAVSTSVRETTFDIIRLVVPLEYAKFLNNGTGKMAARPFMKDNSTLRKMQKTKIIAEINKIWPL
jgi:phage gpG-like protein